MNQKCHDINNTESLKVKDFKNLTLFVSLLILLHASCSPTKHLPEGALLYHKTSIKFENPELIHKDKKVKEDLWTMARPVPNAPLKLRFYNLMGVKKKKGLRAWLRKKLGEPPVLYDETAVERTRLRMSKYLSDNGYFGATVTADTAVKNWKTEAIYRIFSKGQYRIRNVIWESDSTAVEGTMREFYDKPMLKSRHYYKHENLVAERTQLAQIVNDHGFPDFSPEHIYYFIDTTAGDAQITG